MKECQNPILAFVFEHPVLIWGQKMYLFFEKSAYYKKYLFAAVLQQKPCINECTKVSEISSLVMK